jgi:hypothetical protein
MLIAPQRPPQSGPRSTNWTTLAITAMGLARPQAFQLNLLRGYGKRVVRSRLYHRELIGGGFGPFAYNIVIDAFCFPKNAADLAVILLKILTRACILARDCLVKPWGFAVARRNIARYLD